MICLQISWISFLMLTFWFWKSSVFPEQIMLQTIATLVTMLFGIRWIFKTQRNAWISVMSLSSVGEVNWLQGASSGCYRISQKSKICGAFICLHFQKSILNKPPMFMWLAKDQVSEHDFRRLCRIVLRCQQQSLGS